MDQNLTPAQGITVGFIEIWDTENPKSVINLVPPEMRERLKEAKLNFPELFRMEERDLYKTLGKRKAQPSTTDNRLRCMFWNEYHQSQAMGKKMNMSNVYSGVCTRQFFEDRYLVRAEKVAWLMTPPVSYAVALEEALLHTVEQMRDILAQPHLDKNGKPLMAMIQLKVKLWEKLHALKYGAVVQKSVQAHVHTSDRDVAKAIVGDTMNDLDRRIKELEREDRLKQNSQESKIIETVVLKDNTIVLKDES